MQFQEILTYLARALVLFTAMPIHECAHGYMAHRLGDNTPERQGRLTLNPFVHLDIFGSIMLLFAGFGWAKPVQVDTRNFKHPKRDMALTALAGPLSNVGLALVVMIVYKVLGGLLPSFRFGGTGVYIVFLILQIMIRTNLGLAVFNLLPVPPLDGSKIFGAVLPNKYYFTVMQYERYVGVVLLVLLYTGVLSWPLETMSKGLFWLLDKITYPIGLLF